MAAQPLVSIITPTFNHGDFIGRCIESVLGQTYSDWELLIVDDGSTDQTGPIADRYAGADGRIRVFHRENVGVFRLSETYNHALSHAKGSFVAILEGDDLWMPDKLRLQVDALASHPEAVLCWSRAMIVGDGLERMQASEPDIDLVPQPWRVNEPLGIALNGLYLFNFIPAASIVVRSDVIREIGGFQQRVGLPLVDYPTLLTIATRGSFVFVDEILAKWRWHPNQVTRLFYTDIIERVKEAALTHHDDLPDELRSQVTVTREEIDRRYQGEIHRSYVQSGRHKLVLQQFSAARRDFRNALWFRGLARPGLRLQALAGIGSSIVKTDLEWIARLFGKTDLSWRRATSETDVNAPRGASN